MTYSKGQLSGILFFVAATQFILCLTISEALYPGYSISQNYISDLGVGPSSIVFNSSVFFLGLLSLIGVNYFRKISQYKILNILLFLMSVGAMGVGIFTSAFEIIHGAVSMITFLCAGISAIASSKILKKPLSTLSITLGIMSLTALALFSIGVVVNESLTNNVVSNIDFFLMLGHGGMERMIVYPALMWIAGFGGYLVTQQENVLLITT